MIGVLPMECSTWQGGCGGLEISAPCSEFSRDSKYEISLFGKAPDAVPVDAGEGREGYRPKVLRDYE